MVREMKTLNDLLPEGIRTVAIAGHVNPDGDCVGSTCALYLYLKKTRPELELTLYLARPTDDLMFMDVMEEVSFTEPEPWSPDLMITCDTSSVDRIGCGAALFEAAGKTLSIDHHVTNTHYADETWVEPDASSCAEVLFYLFDEEKIDLPIATALYTGLIHDTGVFQYSNVTRRTMEAGARLIGKGVAHTRIIEDSFTAATFGQQRILGWCLETSRLYLDGRVVASVCTQNDMARFGVEAKDTGNVVAVLRQTTGTALAIFLYETEPGTFKLSLRSNSGLDSAKLAARYGGGGHVKAAGATLRGSAPALLAEVLEAVADMLEESDV